MTGQAEMSQEQTVIGRYGVYLMLLGIALLELYRIRFGMYHDEPSHVIYPKLFASGQQSLTQVWDFLQMPGWAALPFLYFFHALTGGYEGIILFLRAVYVLIQFGLAVYTYRTLRLFWDKRQAAAASAVSMMYVFHFYTFCYKSALYWGALLSVLMLLRLFHTGKRRYALLSAVFFSLAVLGFPTAALLVIPFAKAIRTGSENAKKDLMLFLAVCVLCALLFLLWVTVSNPGISLQTLWNAYTQYASDSDHGTLYKMVSRFAETGGIALAANLLVLLYKKSGFLRAHIREPLLVLLIVFWGAVTGVVGLRYFKLTTSLFWVAFCAFFFVAEAMFRAGFFRVRQEDLVKKMFTEFSVWVIVVILLATNIGIAVVAYGAVFGLMGVVMVLSDEAQHRERNRGRIAGALTASVLTLQLFSLVLLIFTYDKTERTHLIFERYEQVTEGPGKGLYLNETAIREYETAYRIVTETVRADDRLCIFSEHYRRSVGMLSTEATEVVHSSFEYEPDSALPVLWCESFPDWQPTVVIVDESFLKQSFEAFLQNTPFGRYLAEHYNTAGAFREGEWVVLRP